MIEVISPFRDEEGAEVLGKAFCAASYGLYMDLIRRSPLPSYGSGEFDADFQRFIGRFEEYRNKFNMSKIDDLTLRRDNLGGMGSDLGKVLTNELCISIEGKKIPHPFKICARILRLEDKTYSEIGKRLKEVGIAREIDIKEVLFHLAAYCPPVKQESTQVDTVKSLDNYSARDYVI